MNVEEVVTRAVEGDGGALRELLERYGSRLWAEINADIGTVWRSALDADDVMQVTYVEVFLRINQLTARDEVGFVAWVRRIAQNNLKDAIKELGRKKRPSPSKRVHAPQGEDSYVTLVEMLTATMTSPSRHVARDEAAQTIDTMLDCLPPDYGQVIRLYDIEGQSVGDVAKAMGRSTGAIHMLRARAHDHLRSRLGPESDFFSSPA